MVYGYSPPSVIVHPCPPPATGVVKCALAAAAAAEYLELPAPKGTLFKTARAAQPLRRASYSVVAPVVFMLTL